MNQCSKAGKLSLRDFFLGCLQLCSDARFDSELRSGLFGVLPEKKKEKFKLITINLSL